MASSHEDATTSSSSSCPPLPPSDAKGRAPRPTDSSSVEEWRSTHHLHASPASSSSCPPTPCESDYDDDDDDYFGISSTGPRPSDLYGKFTWKIEGFPHISKRELRSNIFEVGGYKWYILVYPQGCDVCNHLSLFLCVADYDKLLPGWSHFAQFTIAIVNRDPKKSKYSDTLHRFCKKEHDWGWKKFMELAKVTDGFITSETLVIKAQVQVIRENSHRLFRCLDSQYRRELVRVYLTHIEVICRRFIDEKREIVGKMMEDTSRWSSFQAFWSMMDDNMRRKLVREKTDVILKDMLKCFFNEKEVTSTLVMDALCSGCKTLNYCNRNKKGKINFMEMEERMNSVVSVENGMFMLTGDLVLILDRAASESLPCYKDDKGHQNRVKDPGLGEELGKDSVVRDERRLTELGKRTVEMFVLSYIFSNRVEVAYEEAIAFKRQEELIREEEAAGKAEIELRAKREAAEKEKRARKKQAKQRRKNQKDKEKDVEEKHIIVVQHPRPREDAFSARVVRNSRLKCQPLSDTIMGHGTSIDVSIHNNIDDDVMIHRLRPKENERANCADWEIYQSEVHQDMIASVSGAVSEDSAQSVQCHRKDQRAALLDDSSSTWSSDSLPPIIRRSHDSTVESLMQMDIKQPPINREINKHNKSVGCDSDVWLVEADLVNHSNLNVDRTNECSNCSNAELDAETVILSLKERTRWLEQRLAEKEEEVILLQERLSLYRDQIGNDRPDNKLKLLGHAATCSKMQELYNGNDSLLSEIEGQYAQIQGTHDVEVVEGLKQPGDSNNDISVSSDVCLKKEVEYQIVNHHLPSWDCLSICSKTETESRVSESVPVSVSVVPQKCTSGEATVINPCSQNGPPIVTVLPGEVPRPSSAPVVIDPQPRVNVSKHVQLDQSTSAVKKLGSGCLNSETESIAIVNYPPLMSERIEAPGKTLCSSIFNNGETLSSAGASASRNSTNKVCFSGVELASRQDLCLPFHPRETEVLSLTVDSPQEMPLKPVIPPDARSANAKARPEPLSVANVARNAAIREFGNMNVVEGNGCYQSINNQPSPSFMFGTITPEVLHSEQQQIWQCEFEPQPSSDSLLPSYQHMPYEQYVDQRIEEESDPRDHIVWTTQNIQRVHWLQNPLQGSSLENCSIDHVARQAMATAVEKFCGTEEFPHLDIINELFDEEKSCREMIGCYVKQPDNYGCWYDPSLLQFNSANFRIEDFASGSGVADVIDDNARVFSYASELADLPSHESHINFCTEFQCSSGSSMTYIFNDQSEYVDRSSNHNWLGESFGMPHDARFDSDQLMAYTHVQYPLQDQNVSMAKNATLSFLKNGYVFHNPTE